MKSLVAVFAVMVLLGGHACADSIDDAIREEALKVTGEHKARLDAEEAAQKEVIEEQHQEQKQLQESLAQQEAEKKRQQEIARKKAEEDQEREYEEQKRREEQVEADRRAKIAQILRNMRQALYAHDMKVLQQQRAQQAALENARRGIQRAHDNFSDRLRQIRRYDDERRMLQLSP